MENSTLFKLFWSVRTSLLFPLSALLLSENTVEQSLCDSFFKVDRRMPLGMGALRLLSRSVPPCPSCCNLSALAVRASEVVTRTAGLGRRKLQWSCSGTLNSRLS